ncbi:hypothetical protein Hanom_Chr17g01574501 [Helianthus anomalus]
MGFVVLHYSLSIMLNKFLVDFCLTLSQFETVSTQSYSICSFINALVDGSYVMNICDGCFELVDFF